jgi:hypothetical protein
VSSWIVATIPDLPEHYERQIQEAILQEAPVAIDVFMALVATHPTVDLDICEEWTARILWCFRFTDLKNAS